MQAKNFSKEMKKKKKRCFEQSVWSCVYAVAQYIDTQARCAQHKCAMPCMSLVRHQKSAMTPVAVPVRTVVDASVATPNKPPPDKYGLADPSARMPARSSSADRALEINEQSASDVSSRHSIRISPCT
jgi:hypothetical protein